MKKQSIKPAPESTFRKATLHIAISTALMGVGSYAPRSYAGSCTTTGPGTYSCSGGATPTDTSQNLTANEVVTVDEFGIDTSVTGGHAIEITNTNGNNVSFTDEFGSDITAAESGIVVDNYGTGYTSSTTVTTTGNITTTNGNGVGIDVYNYEYTGDATVNNSGNIDAGASGISVSNYGVGTIKITNSGTINSGGAGIFAENDSDGTADADGTGVLVQSTGDITAVVGINANNNGAGDLVINTQGTTVTSDGSNPLAGIQEGIRAYNQSDGDADNATSLSITVTNVNGATTGILANNFDQGITTISADGDITGRDGDGISVSTGNNSGDISISAVNVSGSENGINIDNSGVGSITLETTGTITGTNGDGIYIYSEGYNIDISVNGIDAYDYGIDVNNQGSGDTTINSTGDISTDNGNGIQIYNYYGTGSATVNNSGDIDSDQSGINVTNYGDGTTKITNSGTINSGEAGIFAESGSDGTADEDGIGVLVQSTGDITAVVGINANNIGAGDLVINTSGATVTGDGSNPLAGFQEGIRALNLSDGDADNATSLGITVTNVSGATTGILANNFDQGTTTISSDGDVIGNNGDGIEVMTSADAGAVQVTVNNVTGSDDGIDVSNSGIGDTTIIVNGDVAGGTGAGIYTAATDATAMIIINENASVSAASGNAIINGAGDSNLTINSATIIGVVELGDGSDNVTFSGDVDFTQITSLDGGDDTDTADGFIDVLNFHGANGEVDGSKIENFEEFNLNNSILDFEQLEVDVLNACAGSTTLGAGSNIGSFNGCDSNDIITFEDDATVGTITGAGGDDTISVLDNASAGAILSDGTGVDGNDTIIIQTSGTVASIDSGGGDDMVVISNSTISGDVISGSGDDALFLTDGSIGGSIDTGDGDDDVSISDSIVSGEVSTGAGNDSFFINGGSIGGSVDTGEGDDSISIGEGNVSGDILAGSGNDSFSLQGGSIGGSVDTGEGDDSISIGEGNVSGDILAGSGNDSFSLQGGSVGGNVDTGDGEDSVFFSAGNIGGNLDTGSDDDSVLMTGGNLTGTLTTGTGEDFVSFSGGIIGGNIETGAGDDSISGNGGNLTGDLNTGAGDDFITLAGANISGMTISGEGNDSITQFSGMVGPIDAGVGDDSFSWHGGEFTSFTGNDGSDIIGIFTNDFDGTQNIDGGDDSSISDGFIDNLILVGLDLAIPGTAVQNFESLTVDGGSLEITDGEISLAQDAGITSGVGLLLNDAQLNAGSGLTVNGNLFINSSSTFDSAGADSTITGSLVNAGKIDLQNGKANSVVTIEGDYQGGGELDIDVDFANDESDQIVVENNLEGDETTLVNVNDITSGDATGNLIPVIDVAGSVGNSSFRLADGPIISGAFFYDFELDDRGFALAGERRTVTGQQPNPPSPTPTPTPTPTPMPTPPEPEPILASFLPQIPTFEVIPQMLLSLTDVDTLQQREVGFERGEVKNGLRVRFDIRDIEHDPAFSATGADFDLDGISLELGLNGVKETKGGNWVIGAHLRAQDYSGGVNSEFGGGRFDALDGLGIGITGTWYGDNKVYIDFQAAYHDFDIDLSPSRLMQQRTQGGTVIGVDIIQNTGQFNLDNHSADGQSYSIEIGKRFESSNWHWIPQAQLSYSDVNIDAFTGFNGERITIGDGDRTTARAGFSVHRKAKENRTWLGYGFTNLYYRLDDETTLRVGGLNLDTETDALFGEIGLGSSLQMNRAWDLKAEVRAKTSLENFGDSYQLTGNLILKYKF